MKVTDKTLSLDMLPVRTLADI